MTAACWGGVVFEHVLAGAGTGGPSEHTTFAYVAVAFVRGSWLGRAKTIVNVTAVGCQIVTKQGTARVIHL